MKKKNKLQQKLRIDELLNSFVARKISWYEEETDTLIFILTREAGVKLRYVIDKRDGFLSAVEKNTN